VIGRSHAPRFVWVSSVVLGRGQLWSSDLYIRVFNDELVAAWMELLGSPPLWTPRDYRKANSGKTLLRILRRRSTSPSLWTSSRRRTGVRTHEAMNLRPRRPSEDVNADSPSFDARDHPFVARGPTPPPAMLAPTRHLALPALKMPPVAPVPPLVALGTAYRQGGHGVWLHTEKLQQETCRAVEQHLGSRLLLAPL
jgi:hypothetical protein